MLRGLQIICVLFLASCGYGPDGPPRAGLDEVTRLAQNIQALSPDVDPVEAHRAAQIAYAYTHELALQYQITDPPLVHNTKVNAGLRPRGLCWHWAEDMENRLNEERFETLQMHRAIANADNSFRIDHSTAIISAKGHDFDQGIVLDPWRQGGTLFWSPLLEDQRYQWVERAQVMARRRAELVAKYGDVVL